MLTSYVAMLRGINVGRVAVAMPTLRRSFEDLGYAEVTTYLRTGNVVFRSAEADPERLVVDIRQRLAAELGLSTEVLLRTAPDLDRVLADNPLAHRQVDLSRLHVTFLAAAPDAAHLARLAPGTGAPDEFVVAGREVYLHCPNGYGRTKLSNAFLERRLGVAATTRNLRTVRALHELAAG